MNDEIILDTKLVGEVTGEFFVPSYQRGYRWGKDEVTRLLEDVYTNGNKNYCLQPVVIRRDGDRFELIDGQQRLTTLFILLQYIKREFKPRIALKYKLSYKTREKSADYLDHIDEALADSNIDFYHIYGAYKAIDNWFNAQTDSVVVADDIYGYLVKYVKIIWYEVGENEDAISLFTRLNIGKIPLTSAELVKAMFLSHDSADNMDREKQEEISLQWDNMEKELHNDSLWYFLTNSTKNQYQTRIDLVLDLIAGKQENTREKYYTFFRFDEMQKEQSLDEIWRKIQQTFLILKDWFENHELYHKIGYLIASGMTLHQIFELSENKTKDAFNALLDDYIKSSIHISGNYSELSYEKPLDYKKISTLLLLFNVESVRQNGEHTQWFPFDKFKYSKGSKVSWSLEHIHAQQSEGMRTQEVWKEWLKLHIPSVEAVSDKQDELIQSMQNAIDNAKLERAEFDNLQQKVISLLSVSGNTEYLHSIANLALLDISDNAALNNATFDVKRNVIVEMDKKGQYIPFCTKMVFLKYYTPSAENQLHFWGQADRVAYVQAINTVLADYLSEPITLEKEEA
ncbi:DUF262 domain-containing protein [Hespellia stercorisuis]|jgi:uncharacterized protein with ParB-like and HNH nuclease domain|uniref:Uncharacterized conserved protein, contains ParB-like and HNH nuclease domains n=1 Tax=Hespellia stercorisuis DSM 15480 TaxID=1121950 RepID=A0A1M6ITF6_9FIRM|nr:DUF262 domain-containing protein [Hespellia stercorisuis]SHJ37684.1 Uncharacterized conserved protein, contains ParB-like and HNH nuclease domains [Hespellia stercorisuis DSM 15480]